MDQAMSASSTKIRQGSSGNRRDPQERDGKTLLKAITVLLNFDVKRGEHHTKETSAGFVFYVNASWTFIMASSTALEGIIQYPNGGHGAVISSTVRGHGFVVDNALSHPDLGYTIVRSNSQVLLGLPPVHLNALAAKGEVWLTAFSKDGSVREVHGKYEKRIAKPNDLPTDLSSFKVHKIQLTQAEAEQMNAFLIEGCPVLDRTGDIIGMVLRKEDNGSRLWMMPIAVYVAVELRLKTALA